MDGILLIDKPLGCTSHDAVLAIRRRLPRGTKVGHCGTLDPMAGGLLVLLIGAATKSASDYQKHSKVYSGSIRLGAQTDTGDLDAAEVRNFEVPDLDPETITAAMAAHLGTLEMPPPMYSAVKYKGKPLYHYARKGLEVPLQKRRFEVYAWDLLGWSKPEIHFRLHCSHGTYVRSLAVSLGDTLGCPAVLSALRRERIGDLDLARAITLEEASSLSFDRLKTRLAPDRREAGVEDPARETVRAREHPQAKSSRQISTGRLPQGSLDAGNR